MDVAFRDFEETDRALLLDLWAASWSEVYPGVSFEPRRAWFSDHLNQWRTAGGLCRLGEVHGALFGFLLIDRSDGHLDQFCIGSAHKGGGLAGVLLAEARRLSPGHLHLDVNVLNTRAIRFYEREGFVFTGEGVSAIHGQAIRFYRWPELAPGPANA